MPTEDQIRTVYLDPKDPEVHERTQALRRSGYRVCYPRVVTAERTQRPQLFQKARTHKVFFSVPRDEWSKARAAGLRWSESAGSWYKEVPQGAAIFFRDPDKLHWNSTKALQLEQYRTDRRTSAAIRDILSSR